jgi:hypothetical protein
MASQDQETEQEIQINRIIGMFDLFEAIKELNFLMDKPAHAKLKQILMAHYVSKLDELKPNVFVIYLENTPSGYNWHSNIKLMKVLSVDEKNGQKVYQDENVTYECAKVKFVIFEKTGILPLIKKPDKLTARYDYHRSVSNEPRVEEKEIMLGDSGSISYRTFPKGYHTNHTYYQDMGVNYFTMLFLFDQSTYEKIMAKFSEPEFKDDLEILELLRKFNEKKQQRKTDFENGYKQIEQNAEQHKRSLTTFEDIMVDKPVSAGKGGNKRSQKKPPKRCHINSKSHYYCHTSRTQRRKKTQRRQQQQRQ